MEVVDGENQRGRSESSSDFVSGGGSSHIPAFKQIKSLHEICLLAEHIKANLTFH